MTDQQPEIGSNVMASGITTNYLQAGDGEPVVLIHGSGPGVSAYANWRLTIPRLATRLRVLAPDMVGFGFTQRPASMDFNLKTWSDQLVGFLDALGIERASRQFRSHGDSRSAAGPARADRDEHPQNIYTITVTVQSLDLTVGRKALNIIVGCWGQGCSDDVRLL